MKNEYPPRAEARERPHSQLRRHPRELPGKSQLQSRHRRGCLAAHCSNDEAQPHALAALSTVLRQWFRLSALPRRKVRFWKQILESETVQGVIISNNDQQEDNEDVINRPSSVDDWLYMVEREAFPYVFIDCGGGDGNVTSDLMGALLSFLTTPPAHELSVEHAQECVKLSSGRNGIPVALDFSRSSLTPECLKRIQELLGQVAAT